MQNAIYKNKKIIAFKIAAGSHEFEKEIREASRNELIRCPDSDCKSPVYKYCSGESRTAYFAHKSLKGRECDYETFSRNDTERILRIRQRLYEHFNSLGVNAEVEQKLLEHHYSHIVLRDGDKKLVIEICDIKKPYDKIISLEEEYRKNNIDVIWMCIDEYDIKSSLLMQHELKRGMAFVVNEKCTCVSQYTMMPYAVQKEKKFEYTGELSELSYNNGELMLAGFWEEYNKNKQEAEQQENLLKLKRIQQVDSFVTNRKLIDKLNNPKFQIKRWYKDECNRIKAYPYRSNYCCMACGKKKNIDEFYLLGYIKNIKMGICICCSEEIKKNHLESKWKDALKGFGFTGEINL